MITPLFLMPGRIASTFRNPYVGIGDVCILVYGERNEQSRVLVKEGEKIEIKLAQHVRNKLTPESGTCDQDGLFSCKFFESENHEFEFENNPYGLEFLSCKSVRQGIGEKMSLDDLKNLTNARLEVLVSK